MACEPNQDTLLPREDGCTVNQDDVRVYTEIVGDIDKTPTLFAGDQTAEFGLLYTNYRIDVRYERIENVLQMPVAEENLIDFFGQRVECEFVTVAAPIGRKVVSWSAERLGAWPACPSKNTGLVNEVFIREDVTPATPETMPGGTELVYRVSGVYYYGLRQPRGPGDQLPTGIPEYYTGDEDTNTVQETDWKDDVITPD